MVVVAETKKVVTVPPCSHHAPKRCANARGVFQVYTTETITTILIQRSVVQLHAFLAEKRGVAFKS
jgi:hypothetical protein